MKENPMIGHRWRGAAAILAVVLLAVPFAWAADQKISAMNAASALDGTEAIPGVQSSANVKITANQILTFVRDTSFSGALVTKINDVTATDFSTEAALAWDQETYDVGGWHDNATNNTRLTVPAGVSRVRVSGCVQNGSFTAGSWALLRLAKGGSVTFEGGTGQRIDHGTTSGPLCYTSPVLVVTPGDYFESNYQSEDSSSDVTQDRSWFSIERVS
jgi:hypothetical protein